MTKGSKASRRERRNENRDPESLRKRIRVHQVLIADLKAELEIFDPKNPRPEKPSSEEHSLPAQGVQRQHLQLGPINQAHPGGGSRSRRCCACVRWDVQDYDVVHPSRSRVVSTSPFTGLSRNEAWKGW
ncbi:hypothetical protein Hte_002558 [Hypoxylon texense]